MLNDLEKSLTKASNLLTSGDVHNAFQLFKELFEDYPSDERVFAGLTKSMCVKGDSGAALKLVDEFLQKHPKSQTYAELYFIKGFAFEVRANWQEAVKCYETCIYFDPKHFEALYNQGNIFLELGRDSEAMTRYELAIQLNPTHSMLLNNAGIASVKLNRLESAVDFFELAVKSTPNFLEGMSNKAWTLLGIGRAQNALVEFLKLKEAASTQNLQSTVVDALKGSGLAQTELNKNADALISFNLAIDLDPNNPELLNNRGNIYKYLYQWDSAIADFRNAIGLKPDYPQAISNLGNVYKEMGRFKEALIHYQSAIDLQPGFATAHLNKALLLLGQGGFENGFEEYEWRWATPEYASQVLQTSKPMWEPFVNLQGTQFEQEKEQGQKYAPSQGYERVLVWNEQGVGDDIYFVRFLPLIKPCVKDLIVRVDARLVKLFRESYPTIKFISESESISDSDFDAHIPLGSLARWGRLNQMLDGVKSPRLAHALSQPYLHPKGIRNKTRNEFVIGISWKSLHPQSGAKRSLPLCELINHLSLDESSLDTLNTDRLLPLSQDGGPPNTISWVSLQYSDVRDEIKNTLERTGISVGEIKDLNAEQDLYGLAQLISGCDLVISIDNTTAHLAAALGVKTWVVVPLTSDWRWQVVEDSQYGYSSAKIYRQTSFNEWAEPLDRMALDLRGMLCLIGK